MSTVKTANIANLSGTSTSVENVLNGTAKAWVNFNGTGTVAIRASYNVSSITDNGTGIYTVNLTNAMADVNYSVVGMTGFIGSGTSKTVTISGITASDTQVSCYDNNAGASTEIDLAIVNISIFR